VLEALQQVPTLDENDCFQDANTTLLWGVLQRKIFRTKKMQQHGAIRPNFCKDTLSDQSSGLCNFVLSLREETTVNHFFSYVLSHGHGGPYSM